MSRDERSGLARSVILERINEPSPAAGGEAALLLQLFSARRIFARIHRSGPAPLLEAQDAAAWPAQVIWLPEDGDSAAGWRMFERVRGDDTHQWLLVSLSGRRSAHFLGGYAPHHTYLVSQNGSARFYSGRRFHSGESLRARCRGARYERLPKLRDAAPSRRAMAGHRLRLIYIEPTVATSRAYMERISLTQRNGTITGGMVGELVLLLQDVLGFEYALRPVRGDGNMSGWDIGVQELHAGRADILANMLFRSPARDGLVDFSVPILTVIGGAVLDTRFTRSLSEFRVTSPLGAGVWRALLATQLAAALLLWLIARCQLRMREATPDEPPPEDASLSFWALLVLGVSCLQGTTVRADGAASYRLVVSALYLLALLVSTSYSANLLTRLVILNRQEPFQSLQEALRSGWRVTNSSPSLADREMMMRPLLGADFDQLPLTRGSPLEGRNLLVTSSDIADAAFNCGQPGPLQTGKCLVCMFAGSVVRIPTSMAFRPNFPHLRLINQVMQQLVEKGLVNHVVRKWKPRAPADIMCPTDTVALQKTHLDNWNLKNVFLIAGGGGLIAAIVLASEKIVYSLAMAYNRQICLVSPNAST